MLGAFLQFLTLFLLLGGIAFAQESSEPLTTKRIGFIGSLSSFAANYGKAALEGVELAASELKARGENIQLFIEDDASEMKNTVTSYQRLKNLNSIDGLVGGTWWANSIVKVAQNDGIPFLSAETSYNKDAVLAANYFLLQGDLSEWIKVYEPLIKKRGWKKGAIIRFVSGFGETLSQTMRETFSKEGREFVGAIEYTDIRISDAGSMVLRLKRMNPDVVYLDTQPEGLYVLLKRIHELGLENIAVITNENAEDMLRQNLMDPKSISNFYFTNKANLSEKFEQKFHKHFNRAPYLYADIAYYSTHLLARALDAEDPVTFIKSGDFEMDGFRFRFDRNNALVGLPLQIWEVNRAAPKKLDF